MQIVGRKFDDLKLMKNAKLYEKGLILSKPSIPIPSGGFRLDSIEDFNWFKFRLAPRIHKLLANSKKELDEFTYQDFIKLLDPIDE